MRGRPQVYAVERNGQTSYFFTRGGYTPPYVPLTWQQFAERADEHVQRRVNGKIVTRIPDADLETVVKYEQWMGVDASLEQLEDRSWLFRRAGKESRYRILTAEEVSRLSFHAKQAVYRADAKTRVFQEKPEETVPVA